MTFYQRWTTAFVRHAIPIAAVNLLLVLVVGIGASNLVINSGIRVLFSPDDPNLLAEITIEKTYGKEDNILLVIDAGEGDIFTRQHLATVESITAQAWQIPRSRRVDSITNFLYTTVDGDDIAIGPLVEDAATLSAQDVDRVRRIALSEQALRGRLIAGNGKVTAVNVSLNLKSKGDAAALADAVNAARKIKDDALAANPDISIHLAGLALTEQTLAEVTASDGARLMPIVFAVVLLALALLLRSILAALCAVITILLSVMVGIGFAGWAGMGLNSVNVSAPTIIMTLAVADCIHLFGNYLGHLRDGISKREAVTLSYQETLYPVILTSVTTAIGFASMMFSESPPFRELGAIAAVGVVGALWVTIAILPALMLLLPFKGADRNGFELPLGAVAEWIIRHPSPILWISLILIAGTASFIPRLELNDDPTGYFSQTIPLTRAFEVVEEKLSGTQHVHYSLNAGEPGGVSDPQFLRQASAFVDWLRQQPEVTNVDSFIDTLKRLNQVMHDNSPEWHRLPDQRDLAAQYLLLYEISVPYGQDVTHLVSADKSSLKVTAVLKNQKSRVLQFEQRSRRWLRDNAPALTTRAWLQEDAPVVDTRGAGHAVSFASVGLSNINSMLYGSLFAILMVSATLLVAFRSIRFGLLSVIPNLFPALVSLGIWSALVHEVNMAASVVFSMSLGIVVDDTTHFLVRYREARVQRKLNTEDSVRYVFNKVGNELVSTSAVLAAGFLVLIQSDFSVNSTAGALMSLTIVVALVLDLLFLPALVLKADSWLFRRSGTLAP